MFLTVYEIAYKLCLTKYLNPILIIIQEFRLALTMGQGQQKPVINPNQPQTSSMPATTPSYQTTNQPNNNASNDKFVYYMRQALRNCSQNGYLNRDSFNQVLAVLENLNFKRLRDAPIADRLFNQLDKERAGRVSETDFSNAMNQIVSDKNSALMYTFRAYDLDGDNRISKKQFVQLIEDSWRAAFRILAQKCDGNTYGKLTIRDLESWASSKVQVLNEQSTKIFAKLDTQNRNFIQFQAFKQYALNSGFNDITASISGDRVVVPLSLINLQLG